MSVPVTAMAEKAETDKEEKEKPKRTMRKTATGVMLKLRTMKTLGDSTEDISDIGEDKDRLLDNAVMIREDTVDLTVTSPEKEIVWPGKDFVNFIVKDVAEPDVHEADNSDRVKTPRMPWHDVGLVVQGDTARDVAR